MSETRKREDEFRDLCSEDKRIPIAVDFDATLCKPHLYPYIGVVNGRCFEILKKWQDLGCMIILNTMRGGKELQDAINWCSEYGFTFDAIGRNPTQDSWCGKDVYKCYSVLDVDDRAAGCPLIGEETDGRGWVDWETIDKMYTPKIENWTKFIK